jgi:hypothetical protein
MSGWKWLGFLVTYCLHFVIVPLHYAEFWDHDDQTDVIPYWPVCDPYPCHGHR